MSLSLPTILADGSTLMVEHDFITRLHSGDPTLGWIGDERLGVYATPNGIEIKRLCEDGTIQVVMRSKPDNPRPILGAETLRYLAAHDGRGAGAGIADRIIAQNDQVRADQAAKFSEFCDDMADRFEFALMKDVGRTEGSGLAKRLYAVSDFRKNDEVAK